MHAIYAIYSIQLYKTRGRLPRSNVAVSVDHGLDGCSLVAGMHGPSKSSSNANVDIAWQLRAGALSSFLACLDFLSICIWSFAFNALRAIATQGRFVVLSRQRDRHIHIDFDPRQTSQAGITCRANASPHTISCLCRLLDDNPAPHPNPPRHRPTENSECHARGTSPCPSPKA